MNRRIHILAGLTALGLAGFALFLWTGRTDAGADKVAFPANYKDGVLYQVADRYDVTILSDEGKGLPVARMLGAPAAATLFGTEPLRLADELLA